MRVEDFKYNLPEELIAQTPYEKRDEARLLVLNRENGRTEDKKFKDIVEYLKEGDCLVLNNTKVIPARIYGKKQTGGKIEVLLLKRIDKDIWDIILKPASKVKVGGKVYFPEYGNSKLEMEVLKIKEDGIREVKFTYEGIFNELLDEIGIMPLPPYITEELEEKSAYNTIYAKVEGSTAAPTAGLHFTKELLAKIEDKGIKIAYVTLNVGIGTFRPVKVENVEDHLMHEEYFEITKENAEIINETKRKGGRVIAVGTTSCRVLESVADETGKVKAFKGDTNIFIYPGYKFKILDALITNFHLPKSTLIMLVSAFSSREKILEVYNEAVKKKYKFFSFGDAMLII